MSEGDLIMTIVASVGAITFIIIVITALRSSERFRKRMAKPRYKTVKSKEKK